MIFTRVVMGELGRREAPTPHPPPPRPLRDPRILMGFPSVLIARQGGTHA
jgi:hypothetical protein